MAIKQLGLNWVRKNFELLAWASALVGLYLMPMQSGHFTAFTEREDIPGRTVDPVFVFDSGL